MQRLPGRSKLTNINLSLWKRHPGQKQLAAEQRRFNIACMGRRWGKTKFGIDLLLSKGGALDGLPCGWFAPAYKYLEEAWRETVKVLAPVIVTKNTQQHRLELITGGSIEYWTLDTPDAGRSRKYALAIIDEAAIARHLEPVWNEAIRPTLADLQGRAWFLSTPKGGNYFKKLFDDAAHDPEWMRWQMPTSTNPHIQPTEIDAMRAKMPSIVFQQEILAEFVDLAGAVVKRDWLQYLPAPPDIIVTMGVDLALSEKQTADYTAIVVMAKDSSGHFYLLDAQRTRAPFHAVLQFIQQMADKWKPAMIAIEQVQYQAAVVQELLRTTPLPVRGVKPDKDKLTRFLPLLARYEQGMVYHTPGLPGIYEDELLKFPIDEHDDLVDAASYAFQSFALWQDMSSIQTIGRNATVKESPWGRIEGSRATEGW